MTVAVALVVAFVAGILCDRAVRRLVASCPVNLVAGATLPEPDDPRWTRQLGSEIRLGSISVDTHHRWIQVDNIIWHNGDPAANRYVEAVFRCFAERESTASVCGERDKKLLR